ncbi:MAG: dihydropteroate synthase [Planctomycetota bacterium]|nr:dihydropteroate synthase [Planctomycetota bacterium]MDI6787398.1 dihydropteroate synthase [Planctomycetota bacterium]
MLIIGERINGMFKAVRKAIETKDKKIIQDIAKNQVAAGARMLDVNVGPAAADDVAAMQWLVETVQEAVDVPLAIDSAKPPVIKAGLKVCKRKPLINSTTGEAEKLNLLVGLAKEYNAGLLGLTMDEKGIPNSIQARMEIGLRILACAMEAGLATDDIYLDPVFLPVKFGQAQIPIILQTIRELKTLSDPPPKTVCGLSNTSQGCLDRPMINRTILVMAIAWGLDSAIADPLDKDLMDAMISAELLLNKFIYCDSYLTAYRKAF